MRLTLFASIFVLMINQSFACDCGQPIDYLVFERSEHLLTEFPWYVVIENKNHESCGATLIDDRHIVVSAHCVTDSCTASIRARLNDNSTKSISSILTDERYDEKTGAYDFAVLTLDSPVDSQFKPICLRDSPQTPMPASHLISPKAGKNIVDYPYNYLDLYLGSKCPSPATKTHLCVMNPFKVDECPEGLYMRRETNNRFYLAGVTSRCFSTGMPDLYTDVSNYTKSIRVLAPKGCWRDPWDFM